MTTFYHISEDGTPRPCDAVAHGKKCPLGDIPHFPDEHSARVYSEAQSTRAFGSFSTLKKGRNILDQVNGQNGKAVLFPMQLTEKTRQVLEALYGSGLQPMVVGGAVRDQLLDIPNKDVDIEVYGASSERLAHVLRKLGRVNDVGKAFGVLKLRMGEEDFDISLPRRDSKVGTGHKGIETEADPHLSFREAASRRDLTINALMFDARSGKVIDFFGGIDDLHAHRLRHVSDAFREDPLRVLRVAQMSARFGFSVDEGTVAESRRLADNFSSLSVERVQEEFHKLYQKGVRADYGFRFLKSCGWDQEIPGLAEINNRPLWRNLQRGSQSSEKELMLPALVARDMKAADAHKFLNLTTTGKKAASRILTLAHTPVPPHHGGSHLRNFAREISRRDLSISDFCQFLTASGNGKDASQLQKRAHRFGVYEKAEPDLISGDDLLRLFPERKPGSWMKTELDKVRQAQYDRQFRDRASGLSWVRKNSHAEY